MLLRRARSTYIPIKKLCLFFQPVLIYILAVMANTRPPLKQFHALVYLVKRGIFNSVSLEAILGPLNYRLEIPSE